jgi:diguanylate cyclase (GGDEF)-like protein
MTLSLVLYLRSSLLRTIELERLTQSLRDTTDELKRNATKLDHMARHDALTGLPNRVMLRETVASGLQRSRRGQGIGVLYLDLDRFKAVNDTLGHPVGDRLLCEVAGRLREGVREVDTIARLGGDEFAIAQFAADQGPDAETLARRLIETVSQPYDIDGHRVVVGVSIGITMSDRDDVDVDQLLRRADMALYAAKRQGRGTWRRFEPGMEHDAHARRGLEMDLRQALETDGLEVYYQPQVSLSSGQVCGFEALLRWHHPHRGLVNPGDFMRCAEETGLIVPIGERVIRDALLQTAQWPKGVRLAVNMSPFQMARDDLVDTIEAALIASGQTGDRLEMEVTEGTILNHLGHAHNALVRLRALGVSVAMDNFGTGAASLSHLRSFPFDRLKIDQSFVAAMTETQQGSAIVRGILQLAASLGIATIAEGVETQEQLDQLARHGCLEAQGFLFGAAQPAMTLNTLIEHRFDLTARRRDVAESQH